MKPFRTAPLSKDKVILRITGLATIALFFAGARVYNPFASELIVCQFKRLTGYDCPTCGMSRSLSLVMHGQIVDSIAYHPLGVVLAAALIILFVKCAIELAVRKEISIGFKNPFAANR